mmetsp:Transcript_91944/g.268858  ORF Transcript_91944/g.268858 Transcript_91944/m.268858 type:complete len:544 (+) Transcript_91944:59-1690(+)
MRFSPTSSMLALLIWGSLISDVLSYRAPSSTEVTALTPVDVGSSLVLQDSMVMQTPEEIAARSLNRICVLELAADFVTLSTELRGSDHASEPVSTSLLEDLQKLWARHDNNQAYARASSLRLRWAIGVKHDEKAEVKMMLQHKTDIKATGFSLTKAQRLCEGWSKDVNAWAEEQKKHKEGKAPSRWGRSNMGKCDSLPKPSEMVEELVNDGIPLKIKTQLIKRATQAQFKKESSVKELVAASKRKLSEFKKAAEAEGYEQYIQRVTCGALERTVERLMGATELNNRLVIEVNGPVDDSGDKCVEKESNGAEHVSCPEGTSPQSKYAKNLARGAAWGTATFLAGGPVGVVSGAVIGGIAGIPGGPAGIAAGAATGVAAAGAVPLGLIFAPIAMALGSVSWYPTCRCFDNECAYDASVGLCRMGNSELSTNPYQWLPYNGQKCAMKLAANEGTPSCELQPCSPADLSWSLGGLDAVRGTLGYMDSGVHNCLTKDGSTSGLLTLSSTLPPTTSEQDQVENSIADRVKLYDHLQSMKYMKSEPVADV